MDSYSAEHHFSNFHMFVDEFCLQLVSHYHTAVHRREARAQQSDLLYMQGVGQHNPERSTATTSNNCCMVCCSKAITAGNPVGQRLIRPYTKGPFSLSLKNQLHSTWRVVEINHPPYSLAGQPLMHRSSDGPTCWQAREHDRGSHLPAAVVRKKRCPDNDQNITRLASLLSFLVTFHIFLGSKRPGHLIAVSSMDVAPPDNSPKTGRSTSRHTPLIFFVTTSLCHEWVICTFAALLWMW